MGREVRKVPKNWKHPRNDRKQYIPLLDGFKERLEEWEKGNAMWDKGFVDDFKGGWKPRNKSDDMTFEEWHGKKPLKEDYMPNFPEDQKTYYQMYETCSEGTPISPPMATPEELAKWLDNNSASAFGEQTATYDQWLNTIREGSAPSFYITKEDGIISGVEAVAKFKKEI